MRQKKGNDADWNVDKKYPSPVEIVRNPAPQRRTYCRSENHRHAVDRERHAELLRRKGIGKNRLLARLKASSAGALEDAKYNQRSQARGKTAQKRAYREESHASHVKALAAHQARYPAADRQHDSVGHEVRGKYPGGLVGGGSKTAGDVGQGDVGDTRVEHLHKGRQRHRQSDHPWVVRGSPKRLPRGDSMLRSLRRDACSAHLSQTVGSTDIPGRSRWSASCPGSKRILTGNRCTTLT